MTGIEWTHEPRPVVCRVCAADDVGALIALVTPKAGAAIEAVQCPRCGSIDLVDNPRDGMPTDVAVDDYVEVGAGITAIASAFDGVDPVPVTRFLDVGCGYGFALDLGRFAFGWTVVGVEPSLAGRRGAAELDLDIRGEFLTADTQLGKPFDLILASEVVEHVLDPLAFLTALRSQLATTGILLLTTPDAGVVTPASAEHEALHAISPGFHTFVATESALADLLRRAGFTHVRTRRDNGTLKARASVGAPVDDADVPGGAAVDVERYLRQRMTTAPPDSPLAIGTSVRLIRDLVAQGRLDDADDIVPIVLSAFQMRHGVDLGEPTTLLPQVAAGRRLPWSAVGACFALGSLQLQLHAEPELAADHFALSLQLAEFWAGELEIVDLALADLRFHAARNLAFAQTRFAPVDAVVSAFRLADHLAPSVPRRDDILDHHMCRLFVELVARGYRDNLEPLLSHVEAVAGLTARSESDEARMAGLDALYSLGVVHRDAGNPVRAQAAFVECISVCDSRLSDDPHASQLSALCRANLPPASAKESPTVNAPTKRFSMRFRRAFHRPAVVDGPITSFIETYWADTWGTYLDGWAHLNGVPVHEISIEAAGKVWVATRIDRPDIAAGSPGKPECVHSGFSVYVPARVECPVTLRLHTGDGVASTEISLPDRPRPEHPATPASLPDRKFAKAFKDAPAGPALVLGNRSTSEELARLRVSIIGDREVTGLDIHPGHGVDVVGDVHQLSSIFPNDHFAIVYSTALLEHVAAPWIVAAECAKVLKPGGIAVHLAPWVWPTHSEPNDFWRFSDRGLASLFHESLGFRVLACGGSGGVVMTPTPDWRLTQLRFPTFSSASMSWVIAQKIGDPDPTINWPYGHGDVATAQEYPLDGLCDDARPVP